MNSEEVLSYVIPVSNSSDNQIIAALVKLFES